jgi:hypothetical protein
MSYLKINNTDISHLVKGMKIGYETLVADGSGRNAAGDTVLDVINRKVKVYVTFRPMDGAEMKNFLALIKDYVVNVTFMDSKTNALTTAQCYTGTPEPEYYWILGNQVLYKQFNLNFIEL